MTQFRYAGLRGLAHRLVRAALCALCALAPLQIHATCLSSPDAEIRRLEHLAAKDAKQAIAQTEAARAAVQRVMPADHARLASLYAVEAESYSRLELDGQAREAASKGLALATDPRDPVHLDLLSTYAENVYDQQGISKALGTIAAARALQPAGSLADTCLLITLGRLQFRQDRADVAIVTLTQAYRASLAPSRTEQRVLAAAALSPVMRSMGDYTQALALNQEVIDWDTARGATLSLSVSRFLRGSTLMAMGDYRGAIGAYDEARELSAQLGDQQGIAFADVNTCDARIRLGEPALAAPQCENALQLFSMAGSVDMVKETRVLLANIELMEGRPERARALLNAVMDHGGTDISARRATQVYDLRARAHAALHKYREAYSDLAEYTRRYAATNDAERSRQAAIIRARFETDREIERNASLRHELALAHERTERQRDLLQWTGVAIAAGLLVITLLTYILLAGRGHRRQLLQLASLDGLTALPNRRHVTELASAALLAARSGHQLVTVAVIDLDHFKVINDRCGHATGDTVLQQFAKLTREALRSSDICGRWGGEEFLLVMPDTTLDLALAILERLRAAALAIELPASSAGLKVSLSAGLATNEEDVSSLDQIVARADAALYQAKHQGRDLVRIADESYRTASTGVRRAIGGG
jgi:diguanylate cyclase (GGDEF)-like protein